MSSVVKTLQLVSEKGKENIGEASLDILFEEDEHEKVQFLAQGEISSQFYKPLRSVDTEPY